MLKQRLRDQYIQECSTNIRASPKLEHFCKFKDTFCFEDCLSKLQSNELRRNFTNQRLGSHKLEIVVDFTIFLEKIRYVSYVSKELLSQNFIYYCVVIIIRR